MWLNVLKSEQIRQNVSCVCAFALKGAGNDKPEFLRSLNLVQKVRLAFDEAGGEILVNFGDNIKEDKESFLMITNKSELPVNWRYGGDARREIISKINAAFDLMDDTDAVITQSIKEIIGTFICAKVSGFDGGSLSNLIGAIWIALKPEAKPVDFAELILHEFVHNALFLDDMVNCIFLFDEKRMGEEDGLVTSSILKIKRGYDKAFHSAYVATTLSNFYLALGENEKALAFIRPVKKTTTELYEKTMFLSNHGVERLNELDEYQNTLLKQMNYEQDTLLKL